MSKKLLTALILIGLVALVLIYNSRGNWLTEPRITIDFIFTKVELLKSVAFLIFAALGTTIGVLLHK
ncbi:MAG: hypothetical protein NTY53_02375 [Kiritimatiellaeota bacterium]|nr:hypothetical protein [Kiritimatiellota bacterium]